MACNPSTPRLIRHVARCFCLHCEVLSATFGCEVHQALCTRATFARFTMFSRPASLVRGVTRRFGLRYASSELPGNVTGLDARVRRWGRAAAFARCHHT